MTSCQAELSRVGIADDGATRCATPPGTFRCGTEFCTRGTQYCQTWYSDEVPQYNVSLPYIFGYSCADLAAGCDATAPTCACVTSSACGDCTVSADGDLTAMCLVQF